VWSQKALSKYIEKVGRDCRHFYQSAFPRYQFLQERKEQLDNTLKSCSLSSLRKPSPLEEISDENAIVSYFPSPDKDPLVLECENILKRMGIGEKASDAASPAINPAASSPKDSSTSHKRTLAKVQFQLILQELDTIRFATIDRDNASHYKARYKKLFAKCSSQGAWQEALQAYEALALSGFELTIETFHYMISACRNSTPLQPDKAIAILLEIEKTNVEPVVRTFNLVIEICGLARQWRKAVSIFPMIIKSGLVPTTCTYLCLSQVTFFPLHSFSFE
jgi:pentatricopeptide repeat protein